MIQPLLIATTSVETALAEESAPLDLDRLAPGTAPWEVEIGFGRGSYLVQSARRRDRRWLGVEMASEYYRIVLRRIRHWRLDNVVLVRGAAQYVAGCVLPAAFAEAVHVYFPDPWPKARHHKRRLFDPTSIDLVLRPLTDGGRLFFATDHAEYGEEVAELLESHPALEVQRVEGGWPDGARTNYEAKYVAEGRPIVRRIARLDRSQERLHPAGAAGVLAAVGPGSS